MSNAYVASNKASSTVAANFNDTATAFTVATGEGARFPSPTGGDYTLLVLQNVAGVREIICVVGRTGDVFTVGIPGSASANVAGRNYESIYGMSAASWVIGDVVSCRPTAGLVKAGVNFGASIAAGTSKATPVDADMLGLYDSAATSTATKLSWANLKATLFASWGALTTAGTSKATPVDVDSLAICDSASSDATKKLTWANVKATLKTYFDTLYGALATVNVWTKGQRGAIVTLTDGVTIAVDMALGNNFRVLLGGNRTLGHPTNLVAGQSGIIDVHQDATGSRTLALAWGYSPPSGVAPTLSTAALTRDQWAYYVGSADTDTVTITEANPGVVTWTAHGFVGGEKIRFTTTGTLPTNLAINTTYYIKPVNTDTFQVSATLGGAAINTSGAVQAGVHTAIVASITLSQLKAIA